VAQITTGLRAILSHPHVYMALQIFMGAQRGRKEFADEFIRPQAGDKVLDVGCGTADIVDFLPNVEYWGFDISAAYIKAAQIRFGARGHFIHRQLNEEELAHLPNFDMVLALGLVHHLDDKMAMELLRLAYTALRPGGRLLTIDPCIMPDQNPIARFLVKHDRGQNVRGLDGYLTIAAPIFKEFRGVVRHHRWIVPYTHCIMECTK